VRQRYFIFLVLILLVVAAIGVAMRGARNPVPNVPVPNGAQVESVNVADGSSISARNAESEVPATEVPIAATGGDAVVENPQPAVAEPEKNTAAAPQPPPPRASPIGSSPAIEPDVNAQVASVADALRSNNHPERLSALAQPAAFDVKKFKADPRSYVDVVEPGRAFQSAKPATGVSVLRPAGSTSFTMKQDASVTLKVRTLPDMPATFTSFDLGHFANQLTSQTVIAGHDGIASVVFSAGSGTINTVRILAASPVCSGQVAFDVDVAGGEIVKAAPVSVPAKMPQPEK
jgi:hypothetical protein